MSDWILITDALPEVDKLILIRHKVYDNDDNELFLETEGYFSEDSDYNEWSDEVYFYNYWYDSITKEYLDDDAVVAWAEKELKKADAENSE